MSGARIWALVSGYPRRLRANKVLVFLQAFIDDSVAERGDGRLFMAGYINTVENWAKFSDDWDKVLKREPQLPYLRMVEANALRGRFRGWNDAKRDLKIAKLAKVIRRYRPEVFCFTIDRAQYLREVRPVAPRGLGSAHYCATFGVVSLVTRYLSEHGFDGKVDFIFDEQSGVSADIGLFFEYMCRNLPPGARKIIARVPQFGSDKDMLPLQAADMIAWHLRREHEFGDVSRSLQKLFYNDIVVVCSDADSDFVSRIAHGMSKIPGAASVNSKSNWRKFRANLARMLAAGYTPPRGTKWRNRLFEIEQNIRWWLLNRRHRRR